MDATKANTEENNNNKEDEVLPGFRFHPTDEELVGFYLRRKVEKKPLKIELIKHIDIYKYDPWDLPKASSLGEKEWYFFCIRGRKYRNSIRPNRVTGSGFWKATGIDKPIYSTREPHDCIGLKKSLVYYRGSAGKGTKTDWMMHEFRLPPNNAKTNNLQGNPTNNVQEAEVWTLCRIFKRIPSHRKYTPMQQETTAAKKLQTPMTDFSSSKSDSFESDNCSKPYLTNFKDSIIQQNERKQINIGQADERSHFFMGQFQAAPFSNGSYSSFWNNSNNNNGDDVFANGNWDELRSVVQFAMDDDPSTLL